MAKTPIERYHPGNIPDTLPALVQFLYDELWRIAQAFGSLVVGMNVTQNATNVPVQLVPVEYRLFEGETPGFDLPGGDFDVPNGEWHCPATGIYQFNVVSTISPFGSGNKDYYAQLKMYIDDVEVFTSSDAGQDNFLLTCSIAISTFIPRESVVRYTITIVHDQFTGLVDVNSYWGISSTALQ